MKRRRIGLKHRSPIPTSGFHQGQRQKTDARSHLQSREGQVLTYCNMSLQAQRDMPLGVQGEPGRENTRRHSIRLWSSCFRVCTDGPRSIKSSPTGLECWIRFQRTDSMCAECLKRSAARYIE